MVSSQVGSVTLGYFAACSVFPSSSQSAISVGRLGAWKVMPGAGNYHTVFTSPEAVMVWSRVMRGRPRG